MDLIILSEVLAYLVTCYIIGQSNFMKLLINDSVLFYLTIIMCIRIVLQFKIAVYKSQSSASY